MTTKESNTLFECTIDLEGIASALLIYCNSLESKDQATEQEQMHFIDGLRRNLLRCIHSIDEIIDGINEETEEKGATA